jgi:predicted amidohydrolase
MHIFLLQHNPTPGDFKGNTRQLADMALRASAQLADGEHALCLVPAYALAGVPWESLKHVGGFYSRCREAAQELAEALKDGPDLLLSLTGAEIPLYALLSKGRIHSVARQPNGIIRIPGGPTLYLPETDPAWAHLEAQDLLTTARMVASVDAVLFTASEYFVHGAQEKREMNCAAMAQLWNMPVIYVQQCGAVDGFIYSGQSFVLDASGHLLCRAAAFKEDTLGLTLDKRQIEVCAPADAPAREAVQPNPQGPEALYRAIVLGIRDYMHKCGVPGVVIGLSGGMDSALVACLAVDALGAENVLGVLMPSQWSSDHSISDAKALAANLGIKTKTAIISPMMAAFDAVLAPLLVSCECAAHCGKHTHSAVCNLICLRRGIQHPLPYGNRRNRRNSLLRRAGHAFAVCPQ